MSHEDVAEAKKADEIGEFSQREQAGHVHPVTAIDFQKQSLGSTWGILGTAIKVNDWSF